MDKIFRCNFVSHLNDDHACIGTSMKCYNLNIIERFFLKLAGFKVEELYDEEEEELYLKLKKKYES